MHVASDRSSSVRRLHPVPGALVALFLAGAAVAAPPGGGGGPVPPGTIYYRQSISTGFDQYRMNADGSGRTYMPCPVARNRTWQPPCDGAGPPSRLLHGGQRWFLTRHHVPGETDPYEGPGARRLDLFAVSEDAQDVRLTFDPQLRILGAQRWAPDENASSATISFTAARWNLDGSVEVGSGGIYSAVVLFDQSGNVMGLQSPPTKLLDVGLNPDAREWEDPDTVHHDWSPDMRRIVTDRVRRPPSEYYPWTRGTIDVIDVQTGAVTTLVQSTCAGEELYAPAWSPSGTTIAFTAFQAACTNAWAIQRVPATGGARTTVVSESRGIRPEFPSWSPDSLHLAYVRFHPDQRNAAAYTDVYRVTLATGTKVNLTGDVTPSAHGAFWR